MTKRLTILLDVVLASTARTVRAAVLILAVAVAAGPVRSLELPAWPPATVAPERAGLLR